MTRPVADVVIIATYLGTELTQSALWLSGME